MDTTRLANGYATATASAAKDMAMVSVLVLSTSPKASSASTAPTANASRTDSLPLVTGRCAVRRTWRSKSRSATSLMQHPALRISTVPSVKTSSRCQPGKPPAANHKALSVGHSKSNQPAGRFQRIRSR